MDETQIYQTLKERFGYDSFRDGQLDTIKSLLAGNDTMTVMPTGGGKSLLYQLPGYLLPGAVLVVSPLISLMQDQVDRLRQNGEKQVMMLSARGSKQERRQQLNALRTTKFIFASPEQLANPEVIKAIQGINLSLLTIDEAHCISQWGPDFRPEYLLLKHLRHQLGNPRMLLLTATATPRVRADVLDKVGLASSQVTQIIKSVNRPNIFLAVEKFSDSKEKQARLIELVKTLPGAGVVYFSSRRMATAVADLLRQEGGMAVEAYHAGMATADRYRIQQQFMRNQLDVICATSAFGMGVDKNDIRFVIHYHLPTSMESYVQEIGRAGRDGKQSVAVLLYSDGDEGVAKSLTSITLPPAEIYQQVQNGKLPSKAMGPDFELFEFYIKHHISIDQLKTSFGHRQAQLSWQIHQVKEYVELTDCRREFILSYFGEEAISQSHFCCDIDSPEWFSDRILPERQPREFNQKQENWKSQLQRLLNLHLDKQ
ncbi:MAG: ATP-dependent DNA helicase RecQ [Limosilactobacillus sp.]|uniref:RecQ family ATP-dependent DNA helicase n=1 Tax=Limosilactobacillus sp. TaxID=2773925 RepID=UPI0026FCA2A4|nr:ATP-dependent DNA helicase RecQ [Limosilactobacillus sp.]